MAGDWMMIDLELPDKPEVHHIARLLKMDPDAVIGKLIRVWSWFDKQTENGHAASVTDLTLNRFAAHSGFAQAMAKAGWLKHSDGGVSMPNFDRWNGKGAKKRALANRRQQLKRHADVTKMSRSERDGSVTREEKRIYTTPIPPSGAFLRFWETWPAHTRKQSKGKCWERWQKQKLDPFAQAIIAHVAELKTSNDWIKDDGQFIPSPLVYLNQRRWEGAEAVTPKPRKVAMP